MLVSNYYSCIYFGDIIKSTLIYYEFNFGGKELVPLPKIGLGDFTKNPLAAKEPKTEAWAGVAALVGSALDAAEAAEAARGVPLRAAGIGNYEEAVDVCDLVGRDVAAPGAVYSIEDLSAFVCLSQHKEVTAAK